MTIPCRGAAHVVSRTCAKEASYVYTYRRIYIFK